MRDYLEIGPSPSDESCAQVGEADYSRRARAECNRFIDLIRAVLGEEPPGAHLYTRSNPHDFGTYYEVAVSYESDDPEAVIYAYRVESDAPTRWDAKPPGPPRMTLHDYAMRVLLGDAENRLDFPRR